MSGWSSDCCSSDLAFLGWALPPCLRKSAVGSEEALQHVGDELGNGLGLAISLAVELGIGLERIVQLGRHYDGDLDRRPVGELGQLQLGHGSISSVSRGRGATPGPCER